MSRGDTLGRVLAIEPDAARTAALRRALGSRIRLDLVIVRTVEDALPLISQRAPDLILTPTFLAPADDLKLRDCLRACAAAAHTQVITLPPFDVSAEPADAGSLGRVLPFRRDGASRQKPARASAAATLLTAEIGEYLQQAHDRRLAGVDSHETAPFPPAADPRAGLPGGLEEPSSSDVVLATPPEAAVVGLRRKPDRRRANRLRASDLGRQWDVSLSTPGEARLVDLSRLGALLETTSPLAHGATVDLCLRGIGRRHSTTARLVRRETASSPAAGAWYRIAAAFDREIELFDPDGSPLAARAAGEPKILAELLGRVLADASWIANGRSLCSRFEEELSGLIRARSVRLASAHADVPDGCETLAFDIPGWENARLTLQVVFERGYRPTPLDVRLLQAAAAAAAVVVHFAPAARLQSPII